jgi:hypothetical protein
MKTTRKWIVMAGVFAVALVAAPVLDTAAFAEEEDPKASDPNMAELKIELPDPSFSGTPLDYWSENLDMGFKPRPKFYAPKGTVLISKGKPVTCSDPDVPKEKLKQITDGDKKFEEESVVLLKPGLQYVQLDLGAPQTLYAIVFWHFHEYERVYFDVIVQVSNDPKFKEGVTTLFHNDHDKSADPEVGKDYEKRDKEYIDKVEGKLVDAKGLKARYVRLYSQGNSTDDTNTYIEVEVYGEPATEGS